MDGGGGSTGVRYTADVTYTVDAGDSLQVVIFFRDESRDTTYVGVDKVWVNGDTLDNIEMGWFGWGPGVFQETLRIGFQDGTFQVDTFFVIPRRWKPEFVVPSGDTSIHEGEPFSLVADPRGLPSLRWWITDAYGVVTFVDTVVAGSTLSLPDTIRNYPGHYKVYIEGWDTLTQDTVERFRILVRGGGMNGPLALEVLPGPAGIQLIVDSVDPDPSDTLVVSPSWPVIRWTPDTVGVTRLVVVRWQGGYEAGVMWDVYGKMDNTGATLPFYPPVYYGRTRSDYDATPMPPDSLTPGDSFQVRIEINNQEVASTFYIP